MSVSYRSAGAGRRSVLRSSFRLSTVAAAALCWPQLLFAEDAAPTGASVTELDTVTVRATPLGRTADELVQPTVVLSGDELESKRRGTIGETLEREPGISTTDFGQGAGRPVIRGQAGPRVDVLENGLSASDASDVSPDHAVTIDPAGAGQIEVLKGPATLLYGSGASAGVVNIIDGRLPTTAVDGLHSVAEGYYGANANDRSGAGSLDYGIGTHHTVHVDFAERKADDYDIPHCAGVDGSGSCGTLSNSNIQSQSAALAYGYNSGGNSFAVSAAPFHTRYGLPSEALSFIDMNQTRYDAQAILNKPLPFIDSVKARGAYNTYTHTEFEDVNTPGTVFTNKRSEERLEAVHAPLLGFRGALGVQHSFRKFTAAGEEALVPPSNSENLGVFLVEERPFHWGKIEFGGRYESDSVHRVGGGDEQKRDFTPLSAAAGAIFNLGSHDHLRLNYTHSERSPVAQELYSFGPHGATATYERGDASIHKELGNNFELGFDHHDGRLTLSASVYYLRALNYIYTQEVDRGLNADGSGAAGSDGIADRVDDEGTFDPDGEFLLVDYKQRNARFYGVEGEARYQLLTGPVKLGASVFGDTVRGRIDDAGNAARTTPSRVGGGVDAGWHRFSGEVHYTRVEAQDKIAALETRTAGYNDLTAELNYKFRIVGDPTGPDSRVFVRGRNLTDDDQRRATSFIKDIVPLPGATVIAGVRVAF